MFEVSESRACSSPANAGFVYRTSALAAARMATRSANRATDPNSPSGAREAPLEASLRRCTGGLPPFLGTKQTSHADSIWPVPSEQSTCPVQSPAAQSIGSRFSGVHVEWLHAHSIRHRLTALATARPTSSVMIELASIDPTTLHGEDAITWLQAHERLTSWWVSLQAPAIVRAAGSDRYETRVVAGIDVLGDSATGHVTIADAIREELAAALRLSPATAQARIDSARLLCGPLSATRIAQSEGRITPSHVSIIVSAAARLRGAWDDDEAKRAAFIETCDRLQRRVLPVAMRSTLARTRRAAKHAVIAVDPLEAHRRRLRSLSARDVYVVDDLDGVSTLIARMATEHAHACLSVINDRAMRGEWADATGVKSESPTCPTSPTRDREPVAFGAGERRSLALASLLLERVSPSSSGGVVEAVTTASSVHSTTPNGSLAPLTAWPAPEFTSPTPRPRAEVTLVIDLPTLLALRDGSAELVGAGAIPAGVVRELLDDAVMRRVIADPTTGELLDYGRRTYAVPQRLRDFIAARDRTCRFPGCGTSATRCEIDHAIPWSRGGETNRGNLGALCVRHHQLKTHGGWRIVDSDPHGGCTWISPQGRRYEHVSSPIIDSNPYANADVESSGPPDPGSGRDSPVARDGPIGA